MGHEFEALSLRIEKLERQNRLLAGLLLIAPALMIVGWQSVPLHETMRVHKLEVVDARGVPMVVLDTGRKGEGGSVTLRDNLGEKRGWWQVAPDGSSFTMAADNGKDNASTAGFGVTPTTSRFSLISPKGSSLSAGIDANKPRIELYDSAGKILFGAPWQK